MDTFFVEKRGAAVLKHGILADYLPVFASKTGLHIPGGRVVLLDGYAGRGRYTDESKGSPVLFLEVARTALSWNSPRCIEPVFVELDPNNYAALTEVLANEPGASDIEYRTIQGDLDQHVDDIVSRAVGASMLAFLDPYGTSLDRARLLQLLNRGDPWPPTEVLLHVSLTAVARIGGLVRTAHRDGRDLTPADHKTISRVDRFLGGRWWQEHFRVDSEPDLTDEDTATDIAVRVAHQFCAALAQETGHRSVTIPVRPQPGHAPKYVLTLFSRHIDGWWHFAAAVGRAGLEWQRDAHDRQALAEHERWVARDERKYAGQGALFERETPTPFDTGAYAREHEPQWISAIEHNIRRSMLAQRPFVLGERVEDVYGEVFGQAWEKHVRQAVRNLYDAGLITKPPNPRALQRTFIAPKVPPARGEIPGTDPTSAPPASDHRTSGSAHPTA